MHTLLHSEQIGRVEGLLIRPERGKDVVVVSAWDPEGLDDHGRSESKRAVTFIQKEHLEVVAQISGQEVQWEKTRRNVLVSGINLLSLVGHRFRVGNVIFEGACLIDPCKNMEKAMGTGVYAAMVGHGGIGGRIIQNGQIHVGDEIQWLGPVTHDD